MLNFEFYNPTKIIFGEGTVKKLPSLVPKNARVLILYGGASAMKNGTIAEVEQALSGYELMRFGGIEPNPRFETLIQAVDIVKKNKIDFLLAVGGGSVIDGTKFVAMASMYHDDPWDIVATGGRCAQTALPIGTLLTLPATGSEMNARGVITRAATQDKLSFRSSLVFPVFSILDPTKTYTLPERQLANGLADSFVHVFEQYMTYPVDAKIPDYFAEGVLKTLIEIAPDVLNKPDDYKARANFMWAATIALNDILATGVPGDWASHRIGHELTALYGIDHARTLAIVLPSLLEIKKKDKWSKLLQYGERVWQITTGSEEERVDLAISKTRQYFESLGLDTHMRDYQLTEKDIEPVIANLIKHNLVKLGEHGDVTPDVSRQILQHAL